MVHRPSAMSQVSCFLSSRSYLGGVTVEEEREDLGEQVPNLTGRPARPCGLLRATRQILRVLQRVPRVVLHFAHHARPTPRLVDGVEHRADRVGEQRRASFRRSAIPHARNLSSAAAGSGARSGRPRPRRGDNRRSSGCPAARAWSDTTMACASANCSRYHGSIIAVSSGRPHMFWCTSAA